MTKNKKKKLRISSEFLIQHEDTLLETLGFPTDVREIRCACPIHGGNNPTAFSFDRSKHIWSCFTNHCEEEYGCDLIGLVRSIKKLDYVDSIRWILKTCGAEADEESYQPRYDFTWIAPDIYSGNILLDKKVVEEGLVKDYSYLVSRGFKPEIIELYGGGLSISQLESHHRFMLFVHNKWGELIGLTGRSIFDQCPKCQFYHSPNACPKSQYVRMYTKWRHYPKGFKRNNELYGIYQAKDAIKKSREAILTEGPLDVLALRQTGVENAVAVFGTTLSFIQCELLNQCGCLHLKLAFDNDAAGRKAHDSTAQYTRRFFTTESYELPSGMSDPGDLINNE